MTEQEDEATEQRIDWEKDDVKDMTYGRRIALALKDKEWYYPITEEKSESESEPMDDDYVFRSNEGYPHTHSKTSKASLEKAWAYFEHVTLPRYIDKREDGENKDKGFEMAEPGEKEKKTQLYSTIWTPHNQLGDFGMAMGLYFTTLLSFIVITLLAGVIYYGNLRSFSGTDYSQEDQSSLTATFRGSATCTDYEWVPVPDYNDGDKLEAIEYTQTLDDGTSVTLHFAMKLNCLGATKQQGFTSYAALIFVTMSIIVVSRYLKKSKVEFDEDRQSPQDYSVTIANPPPDANDPEEWRRFFEVDLNLEDKCKVSGITVALQNGELIQELAKHRELMRRMEVGVEPGTSLDLKTLEEVASSELSSRTQFQKMTSKIFPGLAERYAALKVTTEKIRTLVQNEYDVVEVIVTFEKEAHQREVLNKFNIGESNVASQRTSALPDASFLFRDKVLSIYEAPEPDDINWSSLQVSLKTQVVQQMITNGFVAVMIVLFLFFVHMLRARTSATVVGYSISIANQVIPLVARFLMSKYEKHATASAEQASLFLKLGLFRITTTCLIITLLSPFYSSITISKDTNVIEQVYALFYAEVTTTAALQFFDPMGNLARHYFAPRAVCQEGMLLNMHGSGFELAERYTSMTKNIFLGFWFCAIFPAALLWSSLSLLVMYILDRYSLMRTWTRPPQLGTDISELTRIYCFPLAVAAMAMMSSYFWSAFPFDNVCEGTAVVPSEYVGTWSMQREIAAAAFSYSKFQKIPAEYEEIVVTVNPTDIAHIYCVKDYFRTEGWTFPYVSLWADKNDNDWMTSDQKLVTNVYGWTVVGILALMIFYAGFITVKIVRDYYSGSYKEVGKDQEIDFHDPSLNAISLYIPEVKTNVFKFPLLACNVDNITEEMLAYEADVPEAYYDLTRDAKAFAPENHDIGRATLFSRVVEYQPDDFAADQAQLDQKATGLSSVVTGTST